MAGVSRVSPVSCTTRNCGSAFNNPHTEDAGWVKIWRDALVARCLQGILCGSAAQKEAAVQLASEGSGNVLGSAR